MNPLLELENKLNVELETKTQSNPTTQEHPDNPNIERGYDRTSDRPASASEIIDRRLSLATPELQEQVAIEDMALDAWVAFKVQDYFVERIYKGNGDFTANLGWLREQVIMPTYREEQVRYLEDSRTIVSDQIPEFQERLQMNRNGLSYAEKRLSTLLGSYQGAHLTTDEQSILDQARDAVSGKKKNIGWLTQSIANSQLRAQTKEAMFAHINRLLTTASEDEVSIKVDKVTRMARNNAYQVVINELETQKHQLETRGKFEEMAEVNKRIDALKAELEAYSQIEAYSQAEIEDILAEISVETPSVEQSQPPVGEVTETQSPRVRRMGAFGLSSNVIRAAFSK